MTGQTFSIKFDLADLYKKNQIEVINRRINWFVEDEAEGIYISKGSGTGIAWIRGFEFSNGVIELDIAGIDVTSRSIAGVAFHAVDKDTLDAVYFLPFSFHEDDPEGKSQSVRYISLPENTITELKEKPEGTNNNPEEQAIQGNKWFHVRIVVQVPLVTVYVNGSKEPALRVNKLNDRRDGRVGFLVGDRSDGYFANLKISTNRQGKIR